MIEFYVVKEDVNAKEPYRAEDSIGFDLYSVESVRIPSIQEVGSSNIAIVSTGISVSFEGPYGAFLWDRSSMGAKGVDAVGFYNEVSERLAGCIEGTYRGVWKVVLANISTKPYVINSGDKIAQVVFQKVELPIPVSVDLHFLSSVRGKGGFVSTGR